MQAFIQKYDVPGPRYTSYPTVPYWDGDGFNSVSWLESLRRALDRAPGALAVYVHLPYCESLCTFCGCTRRITRNHAVERPYVDRVLREFDLYREALGALPPVGELHLGGGTPTFFSPQELARLVVGLIRDGVTPDADLAFEAHPASTSDAHLEVLRGLGFTRLSLGVQDFDPRVQAAIHRLQSFESVARVSAQARAAGYDSINFDLVYGLPRQRLDGLRGTLERVLSLRPDRIAYYGYAHVPWIKGNGQRGFEDSDLPGPPARQRMRELGRAVFTGAGYVEIGMDHFALPDDELALAAAGNRLHRSFMGYTPAPLPVTLGLGMSAIGDAGSAYAQNQKDVARWGAAVDAGVLPLLRGHLLTPEDRALRTHIQELMCCGATELGAVAGRSPALRAAEERLHEMIADGLVRRSGTGLELTEQGRPFVRNVCMAFDARLWRRQPQTQLFSTTL